VTTEAATHARVEYIAASTQRITADNEIEYAYRELGEGDVPLVLLQHFRGNLDNWDPGLVDELYPTLLYFNEAERGGHFAAWEEPELFARELRAAFASLRNGRSS
jgi:pimeloyl-ACP methyl ester carboxylesterase